MIQKAYLGKHAVVPMPYQARIQRRNALALGAAATALGIAIAATPGAAFAATEVELDSTTANQGFISSADSKTVTKFDATFLSDGNDGHYYQNYTNCSDAKFKFGAKLLDEVSLSAIPSGGDYVEETSGVWYTGYKDATYVIVGKEDGSQVCLYGNWKVRSGYVGEDAPTKDSNVWYEYLLDSTKVYKEFSEIEIKGTTDPENPYAIGALNIKGDIDIDTKGQVTVAGTGYGQAGITVTENENDADTITTVQFIGTGDLVVTSEHGDGISITSSNDIALVVNQKQAVKEVEEVEEAEAEPTELSFKKVGTLTIDAKSTQNTGWGGYPVYGARGIKLDADGNVTVTFNTEVNAAATATGTPESYATGLYVESGDDATVNFNADTTLTADAVSSARGVEVVAQQGKAKIIGAQKADLTVSATSNGYTGRGPWARSSEGNAVGVLVDANTAYVEYGLNTNVTATGKDEARALDVKTAGNATIFTGVITEPQELADVDEKLATFIAISDNGDAVSMNVDSDANAEVTFNRKTKLVATGKDSAAGLNVDAAGTANVSNYDKKLVVNAESLDGTAAGIDIDSAEAVVRLSRKADVSATGKVQAHALDVYATGDVTVSTGDLVEESAQVDDNNAKFTARSNGGKASGIYVVADEDATVAFNKKTTIVAAGTLDEEGNPDVEATYARGLRVKAGGVADVSNSENLIVTAKALGVDGDADGIYITAGADKVIEGADPATIKAVELDFKNTATITANGTASAHGIHVKADGSAQIFNNEEIGVVVDSQEEAVGILVDVDGTANIDSDKPIVLDVNVNGHGEGENKTAAKGISVTSDGDAVLDVVDALTVNVNNQVPTGGFIDAKAGSDEATGIELTSETGKAKINAVDASTVNVTVLGYENAYGVRLYAKEGKDLDKNDAVFTIGEGAVVTVNAYSTDIRSNQSMPEPYSKKDLTVFGNSLGVDVHADRNAIVNIATAGVLNVSTGVVGADGLDLPGGREGGPTAEYQDDLKLAYGDPYKGNAATVGIHVKSEKNDASLYVSDKDYMTGAENQVLEEKEIKHSGLNVKGAANKATGIFIEAGPEGDNAVMLVRDDATVTVMEAGATTVGTYLRAEDRTQYTVNDAKVSYTNYAGNVKAQGIVLESAEWQAQATIANGSVVSIDIQAMTAETRNSVKFADVAEGIIVQSHEGGDLGSLDDDNHNAKLNVKASQLNIAIGDAEGFQIASKEANGINVFSDGYNALVNFDQVIGDINIIARDEINVIDVNASASDKNKLPEGNKAEVIVQDTFIDADLITSITSDQNVDSIDIIDVGGDKVDDASLVILGDVVLDVDAQGRDIEAIDIEAVRDAELIIDGSKYIDEKGQIKEATAENGHKNLGVLIDADLNATEGIAGIQVNSSGTESEGDAKVVINDAVVVIDEEGYTNARGAQLDLNQGTGIVIDSESGKAGAFINDADVKVDIDAKDKAEVVTIAGDEAGALIVNNADIELEAEANEVKAGIAISGDNVFVVTNNTDLDIEVTDKNVENVEKQEPNGTVGIDIETNADAGEKAGNVIAVFTDTNMDIEVANDYKAQGIDVDAGNDATVKIVDKDHDATDPDLIFIDAEGQGKNKGINIDAEKGNATVVLDADLIDIDVNGGENAQGKDTPAGKGTGIEIKADKNVDVVIDSKLVVDVIADYAEDGIEVIATNGNASVKANDSDLQIKVIDTKAEAELEDKNTSEGIDVYGGGYASVVLKDTDVDITVANKVNAKDVVIRATGLPQQSTTAEVQTSETTDLSDTSVPAAPIKREVANGNAEFIVVNTGKNGVFDIDAISDSGIGIDVSGANDATVVISVADTNIDVYGLDEKLQKAPAAGMAEGISVAAGSKEGKTSEAINGGNASVTIFNSDADINVIAQDNARGIGVFSLEGNASAKTDNSELTINALGKEAIEGENEAVGINVSSFGTNKSASVQLINTETEITAKRGLGAKDIAVTSYQGSAEVIVSDKTAHSKLDLDAQSANAAANIDVNGYMGANVVIDGVNTVDLTAGEGSNDPTKLANKASVITADTVYGNANVKVNNVDKLNIGVAAKTVEGVIVADATNEDTLGATCALFGNANVTISDVDDAFIGVYGGEAQDIITALSHEKNLAQKELVAEVAIDAVKGDIVVVADDVYNGIYASGGVAKATINDSDLDVNLVDTKAGGKHDKYATDGIDVRGTKSAEAVITDSNLDIEASNKTAAHGIIAVSDNGSAKVVAANTDGKGKEAVTIDLQAANTKGIYVDGNTGADVFVKGVDVDIEGNADHGKFKKDIPGQKASGIWAEAENGNAGVWVSDAKVNLDLDAAEVKAGILAVSDSDDSIVSLNDVTVGIDINADEVGAVVSSSSAAKAAVFGKDANVNIKVNAKEVQTAIEADGLDAKVVFNDSDIKAFVNDTDADGKKTNVIEVYGETAGLASLTDTNVDIYVNNDKGAKGINVDATEGKAAAIINNVDKDEEHVNITINSKGSGKGIDVDGEQDASILVNGVDVAIDVDSNKNFFGFDTPSAIASGISASSDEGNAKIWVNDAKVAIDLDAVDVEGSIVAEGEAAGKDASVKLTEVALDVDVNAIGQAENVISAKSNNNSTVWLEKVTGEIDVVAGDVNNVIFAEGENAQVLGYKTQLDIDVIDFNNAAEHQNATDVVEVIGGQSAKAILTDTGLDIDATNQHAASGIKITTNDYVDSKTQSATFIAQDLDSKVDDKIDIRLNTQDGTGIKVNSNDFSSATINKTAIDIDVDGGNFLWFEAPANVAAGILVGETDVNTKKILNPELQGKASLVVNDADVDINLNAKKAEVGIGVIGKDAGMFATDSDIEITADDKNTVSAGYSVSAGIAVIGNTPAPVVIDLMDTDLSVDLDNKQFAVGVAAINAGAGDAGVNIHGKDGVNTTVDVNANGDLAAVGVAAVTLKNGGYVQFDETNANIVADGDVAAIGVAAVGKTESDVTIDDGSNVTVKAISSGIVSPDELKGIIFADKIQKYAGVAVGIADVAYKGAEAGEGVASFTVDEQSTANVTTYGRTLAAGVAVAGDKHVDVEVDNGSKLFVDADSFGHTVGILEGVWDGQATLTIDDASAVGVDAKGAGVVYGVAAEINTAEGLPASANAVDIQITDDSILKSEAFSAFGKAAGVDVKVGLQGLATNLGLSDETIRFIGLAPTKSVNVEGNVNIDIDDSTLIANAKGAVVGQGVSVKVNDGEGDIDVDITKNSHVYVSGETFEAMFADKNVDKENKKIKDIAEGINLETDNGDVSFDVVGNSDVHATGKAAKDGVKDGDKAYGIHMKAVDGEVNSGVAFGSTVETKAEGEIAKGIFIEADDNANLGVNYGSSVTANAAGYNAAGIQIKAYDEDHETTEGANIAVNFGSSVTATATADGTAESGRDAKGIDIIAGDNITSMVGFGSTVTATGNANDEGHGIEMRAEKIDLDVVANSKVVATANAGDDALAFEAITLGQTDAINLDVNVAGNSSIIGTANAGKDAYGVDFDVTAGKANIDVAGNSKIVGIANAGVDAIGVDVDAPVAIDIDVADNSSVKGVANATFPGTGNNAIGIDVDSADVDITVDGKSSVGAVANANKTARALDIDAVDGDKGSIDIEVLGESVVDADANGSFAEAIGVNAGLEVEIDVKDASKVFATANGFTGAEGIDVNVVRALTGTSLEGYDPKASINIDVDGKSLVDADANSFGSAKAIEITSAKKGIDVDVTGASKVDADANGATAYAIGIEAEVVNADVVGFSTVEATANGFNRAEGIDIDADKYAGIGVAGGSKVDADANSFGAAYAIHVDVDNGKLEAGVTASTVEANANGKTADALVLNGDEDVNVGFFAGSVVDVEANGYSEAEGITLNSEKGAVNLTVAGSQVYVDNKTVAGDKNTGIHVTSASKSDVDVAYSNIEVGISDEGADRTWIEGVYVASYHGPASIDTLMSNVEVDIDAVGNADEAVGISAHGNSANVTADQSTLIADIDLDGKEVKSGDTTYDVIGLGIVAEAVNDANVVINDDSTVIANVNNKQKSGDTYGIAAASINEDAKVLVLDGSEVTADVDGYDADGILALTADGDAFVVVSGSKATATADGVDSGTAISAHSKAGDSWVRINNGDVTATSSADGRTTAAIVSWSENKTEATNSKLEIINESKVTAEATEAKSATGIGTYSVKGNAETIIDNSEVTATADGINTAWAVNANASEGRSDLKINDSQVTATANGAEVAAINAKASTLAVGKITDSTVTATANGEGDNKAYAINIDSKVGSYLDIDGSEVTATATNTAGAADHKYTIGINVESDGVADFDLTNNKVQEGVIASAKGYQATGISVDAGTGEGTLVIEDSYVRASGEGNGFAEGIWVDSKENDASIIIDGSVVRADGNSDGDARGMIAVAAETGTIDISNKSIVIGDATSSAGNAAGIEVEATNGGVNISGIANDTYVTGKATAQAGFATGILVDNESFDDYEIQAGGDLYVRANISSVNAIADGNVARGILVNSVYGENQADEAVVNIKGTWYGVDVNGNKSASGIYANGEEATVEAEHSNGTVTAKANGLAYGVGVKADNTGEINIIGDKTGQNVLWHGINVTAESVDGKAAAFNVNAQDGGVNITDYAYAGLNATSQNGEAAGIDVNNNSAAKGGDLYVNIKNSTLWDTANGYKAAGIDVNLGTDYVANTADVNIIGSEVSITANGQTNSRGIGAKGNYVDINIINSNTGILADPTVAGGKAIGVAAQGYYDADVLVEGGAGFNCYAIAPTEAIGILSDAAHGNATLEIKDIDGFDVRGASCDVNIGVEVHAGFGDASLTFDNATGKLMGDGYGGSDYSIAALTLVDEAPTTDFIYFENGSKLPSWEDVQVYNPAGPAHGRVIGYGDGQITSLDSWEVVDEVDITK